MNLCREIIFHKGPEIGKKAREILWRRGFYQFIAFAKKNYKNNTSESSKSLNDATLNEFLLHGIINYKDICRKMEEIYDLDLKLLIDFSILQFEEKDSSYKNECKNSMPTSGEKSLELISFALETIHSSLICLGDLHRYEFVISHYIKLYKLSIYI